MWLDAWLWCLWILGWGKLGGLVEVECGLDGLCNTVELGVMRV